MSRLRRALLACLVTVLLLAVAGCGDRDESEKATPMATVTTQSSASSDEWDRLLDQARALEDENAALEAKLPQLMGKLQGVDDPTPKKIAAALKAMKEGRALSGKAKANFASLTALWDEMANLNISEENTMYAGQQKEIAELDARTTVLADRFFAKLVKMLSQWRTISEADAVKLGQEANAAMTKGNELQSRIDELKQASEQYFKDNGLGE